MTHRRTTQWFAILLCSCLFLSTALAAPPVRNYDAPGAPEFKRLKIGENPPVDEDGNYVIGPDYSLAPELKIVQGVPQGKVQQFTIDSKNTRLFNPGIARNAFGKVDPNNPKTLIVETHEIDYKRQITVYVPAQYVPGTAAPFMVCHDGPKGRPNMTLPHILDNLIAQRRVPAMITPPIAACASTSPQPDSDSPALLQSPARRV